MNKKVKIIMIVLVVALVAFLAVMGKNYYQRRYVGTAYYGKVSADQSTKPVMQYSSGDRKEMGLGMDYEIKAYDEKGDERVARFDRYTENPKELLQPNEYVKFSLSKEIVLKHEVIDKSDVPQEVLAKLN